MGFKDRIAQHNEERADKHRQAAANWYDELSLAAVLDDMKASGSSLTLTGFVMQDQKTAAIVSAQLANLTATMLVAKKLDRVIELLEAQAQSLKNSK
jgi:hypothetical protein